MAFLKTGSERESAVPRGDAASSDKLSAAPGLSLGWKRVGEKSKAEWKCTFDQRTFGCRDDADAAANGRELPGEIRAFLQQVAAQSSQD